ncbi:MAG: recombinase family protein [Caulobacterales bacterium]
MADDDPRRDWQGNLNIRPELERALRHARLTGAVLVIAKLDRLSRNAAFLLALRDSGVRFMAADMPDANDLTIGIMAVVAQGEREAISRRTAEALAAVRDRIAKDGAHHSKRSGRTITRLGNPNGAAALRLRRGNAAAVSALRSRADESTWLEVAAVGPRSLRGHHIGRYRKGAQRARRTDGSPSTMACRNCATPAGSTEVWRRFRLSPNLITPEGRPTASRHYRAASPCLSSLASFGSQKASNRRSAGELRSYPCSKAGASAT